MAEIRLQYRWVPSALEPLPSLTHEGPWCRDAVPTGYKLEQRSYCCRAMGFSLGQWQRHPETKRRIMVAGSGATFLTKGRPTRRNQCGRSEHWIFKAWGNLLRWDKNRRTDKAGILPMPAHRSEFPPAIPRRVASQQSPLPLRRILTWNQEPIPLVKVMLQASIMPGRKNSPPPLDSTHISCRLAASPNFGSPWRP